MKYINLVFIQHPDCFSSFLFSVPLPIELKKGDMVFCDTAQGTAFGTCAGDSFVVAEHVMEDSIAPCVGAYLPLKSVVGKAIPKETYECERFDRELPF